MAGQVEGTILLCSYSLNFSCLKVRGGGGGSGVDLEQFSVSPRPLGFGFGTLGLRVWGQGLTKVSFGCLECTLDSEYGNIWYIS